MWKDIKNYEGLYQIDENGNVKSLKRFGYKNRKVHERILKPCIVGKGYLTVCLRKNGETKRKYIHQMVCQSFVPNLKSMTVVNHIDGNKLNNNYLNLEWCSYSENNQHAYDNALKAKGENFYNSKLTQEQVNEIRKLGKYTTYQKIGDKYGVSKATIRDVLLNKTW